MIYVVVDLYIRHTLTVFLLDDVGSDGGLVAEKKGLCARAGRLAR